MAWRSSLYPYSIGLHRTRNILDVVLAGILEGGLDSIAYGCVHGVGQGDPARLCQPFQSRGDVDAVAVHGAVRFFDHIAKVHADPKTHAPLLGHRLRAGAQFLLNCQRPSHGARGRIEHGQYRVTGHVDDAALVRFNLSTEYRTGSVERRDRRTVVAGHQARVIGGVCRENCGQAVLETTIAHLFRAFLQRLAAPSYSREGQCKLELSFDSYSASTTMSFG